MSDTKLNKVKYEEGQDPADRTGKLDFSDLSPEMQRVIRYLNNELKNVKKMARDALTFKQLGNAGFWANPIVETDDINLGGAWWTYPLKFTDEMVKSDYVDSTTTKGTEFTANTPGKYLFNLSFTFELFFDTPPQERFDIIPALFVKWKDQSAFQWYCHLARQNNKSYLQLGATGDHKQLMHFHFNGIAVVCLDAGERVHINCYNTGLTPEQGMQIETSGGLSISWLETYNSNHQLLTQATDNYGIV